MTSSPSPFTAIGEATGRDHLSNAASRSGTSASPGPVVGEVGVHHAAVPVVRSRCSPAVHAEAGDHAAQCLAVREFRVDRTRRCRYAAKIRRTRTSPTLVHRDLGEHRARARSWRRACPRRRVPAALAGHAGRGRAGPGSAGRSPRACPPATESRPSRTDTWSGLAPCSGDAGSTTAVRTTLSRRLVHAVNTRADAGECLRAGPCIGALAASITEPERDRPTGSPSASGGELRHRPCTWPGPMSRCAGGPRRTVGV